MQAVFKTSAGHVAIVVYGLLALALLLWGVTQPGKRVLIALMRFGEALTSSLEPLRDASTGALRPIVGRAFMFTLIERGIPVWVVICSGMDWGVHR